MLPQADLERRQTIITPRLLKKILPILMSIRSSHAYRDLIKGTLQKVQTWGCRRGNCDLTDNRKNSKWPPIPEILILEIFMNVRQIFDA